MALEFESVRRLTSSFFSGGAVSTTSAAAMQERSAISMEKLTKEQFRSNAVQEQLLRQLVRGMKSGDMGGEGGGLSLLDLYFGKKLLGPLLGRVKGLARGLGRVTIGFLSSIGVAVSNGFRSVAAPVVKYAKSIFSSIANTVTRAGSVAYRTIGALGERGMAAVMKGISKIMPTITRVASFVPRLLGKFAIPLAALMGIWDGVKGWNNAEKTFGKDIHIGHKIASALGSAVNGLTLGLSDWISQQMGGKNTADYYAMIGNGYMKLTTTIGKGGADLIMKAVDAAKEGLAASLEWVSDNLPSVAAVGERMWTGIKGAYGSLIGYITGSISGALDLIKTGWDTINPFSSKSTVPNGGSMPPAGAHGGGIGVPRVTAPDKLDRVLRKKMSPSEYIDQIFRQQQNIDSSKPVMEPSVLERFKQRYERGEDYRYRIRPNVPPLPGEIISPSMGPSSYISPKEGLTQVASLGGDFAYPQGAGRTRLATSLRDSLSSMSANTAMGEMALAANMAPPANTSSLGYISTPQFANEWAQLMANTLYRVFSESGMLPSRSEQVKSKELSTPGAEGEGLGQKIVDAGWEAGKAVLTGGGSIAETLTSMLTGGVSTAGLPEGMRQALENAPAVWNKFMSGGDTTTSGYIPSGGVSTGTVGTGTVGVVPGATTPLNQLGPGQNLFDPNQIYSGAVPAAKGGSTIDPTAGGGGYVPMKTSGGGTVAPGKNGLVSATAAPELESHQRALLDTIAGPESNGRYNIRYNGGAGAEFKSFADHPRVYAPITSGPHTGKKSSAAGRYQFTGSTWDDQANRLGLTDFSPANQDRGAWNLAKEEYKRRTGGDLDEALKSKDPKILAGVASALSGRWASLPGGAQPGISSGKFVDKFNANLANQNPSVNFKAFATLMDPSSGVGGIKLPQVAAAGSSSFKSPVEGVDINNLTQVPMSGGTRNSRSFGGPRGRKLHTGVDIPASPGTNILAIKDGGVIRRIENSSNGYGKVLDIEYPDGTVHRNAHMKDFNSDLKVGSVVPAGTVLGTVGYSGNANANFPHNHYEVMRKDYYDANGGRPPGRMGSSAALNQGRIDPRSYYKDQGGSGEIVPTQSVQTVRVDPTGETKVRSGGFAELVRPRRSNSPFFGDAMNAAPTGYASSMETGSRGKITPPTFSSDAIEANQPSVFDFQQAMTPPAPTPPPQQQTWMTNEPVDIRNIRNIDEIDMMMFNGSETV